MAFGKKEEGIVVNNPRLEILEIPIRDESPLVINKFSNKARQQMMDEMAKAKSEKSKAKSERPPRNYEQDFMGARHISTEGWDGIHAAAFRNAMVDACRAAGVVMTRAKQAIFILPDGFDDEGVPLVRIRHPDGSDKKIEPEKNASPVRNDNGSTDIRVRPMWRHWSAVVRVRYDADMIDPSSVVSLLARAGLQVGVAEGRPFSKNSCGCGWGTFTIAGEVGMTDKKAA